MRIKLLQSVVNGTTMYTSTAKADTDGDGVLDGDEVVRYNGGKGYFVVNSNPIEIDTDFDGINDVSDKVINGNTFEELVYDNNANFWADYSFNYRAFFNDNTKYNKDISTLSSIMSTLIYDEGAISTYSLYGDDLDPFRDYEKDPLPTNDIKDFMKYHGMDDIETYKIGDWYDDEHLSEIAIGHRKVRYNGKTKEIVCVVVRGTNGTIEEWSSNFDIGNTNDFSKYEDWDVVENHKGFDIAANRILSYINIYNTKYLDSDTEKAFWVTGHSRGAAIANIVGAKLEDKGNKTFTYTFAAPNTTTSINANDIKYKSIFNIINTDDFVPYLPMEGWEFTRYGETKRKSVKELYQSEWNFKFLASNKGVINEATGLYNSDYIGMGKTINSLTDLVRDRDECYQYTCDCHGDGSHDDVIIYIPEGIEMPNYISVFITRKQLDKIPSNAKPYCEIVEEGKRIKACQTPAYFMQLLSPVMAKDAEFQPANFIYIAPRYVKVRDSIVSSYIGGIAKPHYMISYYVVAKNS